MKTNQQLPTPEMYLTSFQRTRGKLLSTKTRETPPKTGRVGEERGMQGPTLERGSESAEFRPKLAALIRGITRHSHSARNRARSCRIETRKSAAGRTSNVCPKRQRSKRTTAAHPITHRDNTKQKHKEHRPYDGRTGTGHVLRSMWPKKRPQAASTSTNASITTLAFSLVDWRAGVLLDAWSLTDPFLILFPCPGPMPSCGARRGRRAAGRRGGAAGAGGASRGSGRVCVGARGARSTFF
jgi:hypothetical protein